MSGHGHGHGHCGKEATSADCGHDHSDDPEVERGAEFSLYTQIDTSKVVCYNEKERNMALNIFKPYDQRLDQQKFLESDDDDEQLLLYIPFSSNIRLKSLLVIGGSAETTPSKMKLFTNRDDIDFSMVDDLPAVQEFDVHFDPRGEIELPTRISKFTNVSSLTIYFPENHGAEVTRVNYLGLKGEYQHVHRGPVEAVVEMKPQLSDHKTRADHFTPQFGN